MKLVYLAGSYRGKSKFPPLNWLQRQINIHRARAAAKELWKMGFSVLAPHLNTCNFDGLCPDQVFLDGTMEMMKRCDAVALLPNWFDSSGTLAEIKKADELKIPIYVCNKAVMNYYPYSFPHISKLEK
jgi:nucleoside 2-deoxyribosyltransferase